MTDATLNEVIPYVINRTLAGPLIPLNDNMYLVPLTSRAEVKDVCKLDEVSFSKKGWDLRGETCSLVGGAWGSEPGFGRRNVDTYLEPAFTWVVLECDFGGPEDGGRAGGVVAGV